MPLPVIGPEVSVRSMRLRGGDGVSTWPLAPAEVLVVPDMMLAVSTSRSSGMFCWPDAVREVGLLEIWPAMGMPKKLFRGLTRPGEVGPGVTAGGGMRYMVFTMFAASGLMEAERRWGLPPLGAR